ncbi:MAG: glycoside hydrolase family 20 zincin-like fold domain-containing protein, partial [Phycisphaerae bacterium]
METAEEADTLPLGQLQRDLQTHCPDRPGGQTAVRVVRDAGIEGDEAYRLTVRPDGVEVAAATDAGAYYGVQTLRELIVACGPRMPCCVIEDGPDFARRGVYHDCSRGKVPTLKTLKDLVERLARWKINELQLYVENVFTFRKHPAIGQGFSPFTPEELTELQAHCRLHHVRLVGSLASFGHMEKILALPEYSHLGEMPGFRDLPGGTTLCPLDPGSIKLVADLYEEFVPLHEARDFNVCCDETWELGKGRSRDEAERRGVGRLYLDFLLELHELCGRHGKRMNAWADIVLEHPELLGEMPKDAVMLNWDYSPGGARIARTREIAEAHLPLVVCPGTNGWLSHGTRLPQAVANVAEFAAEGRKCGAEGLLNTDWGDGGHRNPLGASLHGFAHGAAHAWNGGAVDDARFTDVFCRHAFGRGDGRLAKYLRVLGETYRMTGSQNEYAASLYRALVEPLGPAAEGERSDIDGITAEGAAGIVEALSAAAADMPNPDEQTEQFEAVALRELALAGRMDILASRRVLAAKKLRAGETVSPRELRDLAEETRRVADDFEQLWLARNKPSRLRDNLELLERAEA